MFKKKKKKINSFFFFCFFFKVPRLLKFDVDKVTIDRIELDNVVVNELMITLRAIGTQFALSNASIVECKLATNGALFDLTVRGDVQLNNVTIRGTQTGNYNRALDIFVAEDIDTTLNIDRLRLFGNAAVRVTREVSLKSTSIDLTMNDVAVDNWRHPLSNVPVFELTALASVSLTNWQVKQSDMFALLHLSSITE